MRGKNWQLTDARLVHESSTLKPAELSATGGKLLVGCGVASALEILELQPEAKKKMSAEAFLAGYRLQPGERFGG